MKKFLIGLVLSCLLLACAFPLMVFAAEYRNFATVENRSYNGTRSVSVTDMYFAAAASDEDYERMSATATGWLPSPNAGHYDSLSGMTGLKLKERDPSLYPDDPIDWNDWYDVSEDVFASSVIPSDVTIEKAEPELSIRTSVASAGGGQEIQVTVVLANDFDYEAGIPTAEQIEISATNAVLKDGTAIMRSGNQYTATFIISNEISAQKAEFFANVSASATNYGVLKQAVSASVTIDNPADYSAVYRAIEKANALNKDDYKDFSAVKAAIDAVEEGKHISEQEIVNGYAQAIEDAIAALEYKPADYSAVDAALERAEALNKDDYKDFTAVEAAVNAVVRGKNITEQAVVDGYAEAIEKAIAALELKPAPDPSSAPSAQPSAAPTETPAPTAGPTATAVPTASPAPTQAPVEQPTATPAPTAAPEGENAGGPKTGDTASVLPWAVLLLVSGAGTALCTVRNKKR